MFETIFSLFCLFAGLCYKDPLYFIASGVFVIASDVSEIRKKMD